MAERPLTLEDTVAIDFHTHVEMSKAGGDSLPDELREAAVRHFRGESARPTAEELATYYRARKMMAVIFTVDSEAVHRADARAQRGDRRGRARRTPTCSSRSRASTPTRAGAASTRRGG